MTLSDLIGLDSVIQNEYARALIILIGVLVILRLALGLVQGIFLKVSSKTKTDIDDILVKKSSAPLTIIALIIGLRISLAELSFSEALSVNIATTIYSALVIVVGYLVYVVVDTILLIGWRRLAKNSRAKVNESLTNLVHGVLKIALIILVILYVLDLWGVKIIPLLGALGIAGLAVALALQPTLSNIFAGVSMILDKTVSVGDVVVMEDGSSGVVDKIGIRSTKIKSWDNDLIIVPNTKFSDGKIQNVSLPEEKARVVVPFGVAYGSNIEKVKKVVVGEIKKIPHLIKGEEPVVRFLEMGDSSLNFKAFFYIGSYKNRYASLDEANTRIYNALNKAGIEIPFPQMDVHLKNASKKSRS